MWSTRIYIKIHNLVGLYVCLFGHIKVCPSVRLFVRPPISWAFFGWTSILEISLDLLTNFMNSMKTLFAIKKISFFYLNQHLVKITTEQPYACPTTNSLNVYVWPNKQTQGPLI